MLVITRKLGETVQVGDGAVILLEVRSGQVKLGFEFEKDVHIIRTELVGPNPAAARLHHRYANHEDRD